MLRDQVEQVLADVDALVLQAREVLAHMLMVRRELVGAEGLFGGAPRDSSQPYGILVGNLE